MVEIDISYQGGLRCQAVHKPSGTELTTDAPVDNMGKGESFSPTDLVATGLGGCMLTTMAIVAERHGIDITGAAVRVTKEMAAAPNRRIARLGVEIHMPAGIPPEDRQRLENTARACPVHKSLDAQVEMPITFHWA